MARFGAMIAGVSFPQWLPRYAGSLSRHRPNSSTPLLCAHFLNSKKINGSPGLRFPAATAFAQASVGYTPLTMIWHRQPRFADRAAMPQLLRGKADRAYRRPGGRSGENERAV